jgi:Zn-dependent protease
MWGSIRICTVYGIPIAIHTRAGCSCSGFSHGSWRLLRYRAHHLAGPRPRTGSPALVTSLVAFASVLLHELGHSWVAIRHGIGIVIRSITLFIFGGVSRIAQEPPSPGVERRIAVAGRRRASP